MTEIRRLPEHEDWYQRHQDLNIVEVEAAHAHTPVGEFVLYRLHVVGEDDCTTCQLMISLYTEYIRASRLQEKDLQEKTNILLVCRLPNKHNFNFCPKCGKPISIEETSL